MSSELSNKFQHSGLHPIFFGFAASLAGIVFASIFFEEFLEMAATGLTALSLTVVLNAYLEDNRRSIWDEKSSPVAANTLLAARIAKLFGGIFLGALFLQVFIPEMFYAPEIDSSAAYRNEILELLYFNLTVLFGGTVFSLLYRAGGLVTILAWNAIHWSNAISSYVTDISDSVGTSVAVLVSLTLVPHLVIEVIAYVIAGMVGIFISKAIFKYHLFSDEFAQVAKASLFLLLLSVAVLTISVAFEIYLAQAIFQRVIPELS